MVRKFLYLVAFLIIAALAVLLVLRIWADEVTQIAFVPTGEFQEQERLADNAYQNPSMWFSRPGMGAVNDPARWQPLEVQGEASPSPSPSPSPAPSPSAPSTDAPDFAVFFVHPTSFLDRSQWNAPLDHAESQDRARLYVRGMASAFNQASEIWAPRYRQATFGAYLTDRPEAARAIDAAYGDVEQAFDVFLASIDEDMPIVLAGHSQGGEHVTRLMRERFVGTDLMDRLAMAYPIGWPISVDHDLPALGLPACATPAQGGCIVTWSSFAEPADPGMVLDRYSASEGLDGTMRADSPILCVNPVNGMINGSTPASANSGTLVPNEDLTSGELVPGAVPARCSERGLLLIGDPPELGPYVLPGNNYHVYDIPLFWADLQQDVVRRVSAWQRQN